MSPARAALCGWAATLLACAAAAQEPARPADSARVAAPVPDSARTARVAAAEGRAPVVDGRLDEEVWARAEPMTDFRQRQPDEGKPASEKTEVRLVYGPDALYVGARMFSADPSRVSAPVTRRDNPSEAELIMVSLDTYHDRRTAYSFGVTAAGTRLDWYHPGDAESTVAEYDPVWNARVRRDSLGWTAEMRIPYSQLRFSRRAEQVWGINVRRSIPSRNEESYWVLVPRRESGWASRFGTLSGIDGVRPARRAELVPYVTSRGTLRGDPDPRNPFIGRTGTTFAAGADLKVGLGPNLTLDATVNPDFGQVEADPAEVNLTAFETFFPERRPFFTEGSRLLTGNGPGFFYSRRVGAPPPGVASGDYTDVPQTSTILGAAKITGRLPSGTSVGAMAALTGTEYARTYLVESDTRGRVRVAPRTLFGVVRAEQDVGRAGSRVGVSVTAVDRALDETPGDPLAARLSGQALAGGVDWDLRLRGREYQVTGHLGASYLAGDTLALLRLQTAPAHYFQRPGSSQVELDSQRTSLAGYTAAMRVERVQGKHWLWRGSANAYSPGFEINDAGRLSLADRADAGVRLTYRETRPARTLRDWRVDGSLDGAFNFGGVRTATSLRGDGALTWRNFWRSNLTVIHDLRALDDRLTRGGPLMATGSGTYVSATTSTNTALPLNATATALGWKTELGLANYALRGGVTLRPDPRWQFSVSPSYAWLRDPRQYVTSASGGSDATFGRRYVFATVERSEIAARFRLNYVFTPDLSLEMYAEPFAASGRYFDFGELAAARTSDLTPYGDDRLRSREGEHFYVTDRDADKDGSFDEVRVARDFNLMSLRSNAVMRWEWRPGSTFFLLWQQDRSARETRGDLVGPGALWDAVGATGDQILAIKLSYWLPLR